MSELGVVVTQITKNMSRAERNRLRLGMAKGGGAVLAKSSFLQTNIVHGATQSKLFMRDSEGHVHVYILNHACYCFNVMPGPPCPEAGQMWSQVNVLAADAKEFEVIEDSSQVDLYEYLSANRPLVFQRNRTLFGGDKKRVSGENTSSIFATFNEEFLERMYTERSFFLPFVNSYVVMRLHVDCIKETVKGIQTKLADLTGQDITRKNITDFLDWYVSTIEKNSCINVQTVINNQYSGKIVDYQCNLAMVFNDISKMARLYPTYVDKTDGVYVCDQSYAAKWIEDLSEIYEVDEDKRKVEFENIAFMHDKLLTSITLEAFPDLVCRRNSNKRKRDEEMSDSAKNANSFVTNSKEEPSGSVIMDIVLPEFRKLFKAHSLEHSYIITLQEFSPIHVETIKREECKFQENLVAAHNLMDTIFSHKLQTQKVYNRIKDRKISEKAEEKAVSQLKGCDWVKFTAARDMILTKYTDKENFARSMEYGSCIGAAFVRLTPTNLSTEENTDAYSELSEEAKTFINRDTEIQSMKFSSKVVTNHQMYNFISCPQILYTQSFKVDSKSSSDNLKGKFSTPLISPRELYSLLYPANCKELLADFLENSNDIVLPFIAGADASGYVRMAQGGILSQVFNIDVGTKKVGDEMSMGQIFFNVFDVQQIAQPNSRFQILDTEPVFLDKYSIEVDRSREKPVGEYDFEQNVISIDAKDVDVLQVMYIVTRYDEQNHNDEDEILMRIQEASKISFQLTNVDDTDDRKFAVLMLVLCLKYGTYKHHRYMTICIDGKDPFEFNTNMCNQPAVVGSFLDITMEKCQTHMDEMNLKFASVFQHYMGLVGPKA